MLPGKNHDLMKCSSELCVCCIACSCVARVTHTTLCALRLRPCVTRDTLECVARGGSEMLRTLGLCVRRYPPEKLEHGGQFIVDDGYSHAYALHAGDPAIISLERSKAELLTSAALHRLRDRIRSGLQTLFAI